MNSHNEILLVYDKQCPVCNHYCHAAQIKNEYGQLKLVNARENSSVLQDLTSQGLDIDQGMVLKKDNQLYYAADAMHMLALMSNRKNIFNRSNYLLFHYRVVSRLSYPLLRLLRNLLLKFLGRKKINNLGELNNNKF